MVPKILEFSEKLNKPITRILITHCHNDHIGGLLKLKEALPNAKVIVPERESRFMNGDFSLDPDEPNLPLKGGYPKEVISILGIKINTVDNAAVINLGPSQHLDQCVSYKRSQGVGEQNGDQSSMLLSYSWVSDANIIDSPSFKSSIL